LSGRAAIDVGSRPGIDRRYRLQWEPAQSAHVLLYPEGLIKLNGSAGEILKRCDGTATVGAITDDLEKTFATTGLAADVLAFLAMAMENGWVEIKP
jgi:pyrroloquinoline quinone biosynthesis protein D